MLGREIVSIAADYVEVDIAALPGHFVYDRAKYPFPPPGPGGFAKNDFGHIALARIAKYFLDDVRSTEGDRLAAQLGGELKGRHQPVFALRRPPNGGCGFDM